MGIGCAKDLTNSDQGPSELGQLYHSPQGLSFPIISFNSSDHNFPLDAPLLFLLKNFEPSGKWKSSIYLGSSSRPQGRGEKGKVVEVER